MGDIKIKNGCSWKHIDKKVNKETRLRKIICKAHMTKDWYLGYIKNSCNLMKKYSTSLVTMEQQIKIITRYQDTPIGTLTLKGQHQLLVRKTATVICIHHRCECQMLSHIKHTPTVCACVCVSYMRWVGSDSWWPYE